MGEYLTIDEMNDISDKISKQEGQKYPCSNQVVTCGFFASEGKWKEFCEENRYKAIYVAKEHMKLEDEETWHWFSINNYNCRGYRFYKIKVSRDINRHVFMQNIYPYCSFYCKEIEWI